jgi:thiol-disulfide isomerase/thioredoxin
MASRSGQKKETKGKSSRGKGLSLGEKIAIPLILILAVWGVYSFSQPSHATSASQSSLITTSTTKSSGAPDFTLPIVAANGLTGQSLTLSSLQGKVVLLEFMEPWCPHCQNMAPTLESLNKAYSSQNVVFISVSGPWQGATSNDAAKFIQSYGSSWTYLYDSSGTTMSAYGVTGTPTFFIIGKNGAVITSLQGEQSYAILAGLLSEAQASS